MKSPLLLAPLALLLGCPAYEGPIDVILIGLDEGEVLVEWADAEVLEFEECTGGATSPEASAACGPYGVGEVGEYIIRVTWDGVAVEKSASITEEDGSYEANLEVVFEAADFEG